MATAAAAAAAAVFVKMMMMMMMKQYWSVTEGNGMMIVTMLLSTVRVCLESPQIQCNAHSIQKATVCPPFSC
jgi:hypothetical protein